MLLKDDREMALGDIECMCIETADRYASASEMTSTPDLKHLFKKLAERRRQQAVELAPHIRQLGDLPKAPDPDREQIGDVVTSIKAFFRGDTDKTLIEERMAAEEAFLSLLDSTLKLDLPTNTVALLSDMKDEIQRIHRQLQQAEQSSSA